MLVESLATFFQDQGVPATWRNIPWAIDRSGESLDSSKIPPGGLKQQTAAVLFDRPDGDVLSKRVQSTGYKMTFPATQFVGIKRGDAVTIATINYSVLEVNSMDDGAIFEADLEAVDP